MRTVRWLGAFGQGTSLASAFEFELGAGAGREVAAEPINGSQGNIDQARVGLLINQANIVRAFKGDVWSVVEDGTLKKTRKPTGTHGEVWCQATYSGIVIKGGMKTFSTAVKYAVRQAAVKYNLPIYKLTQKGELVLL